jgi:hypothetical protein
MSAPAGHAMLGVTYQSRLRHIKDLSKNLKFSARKNGVNLVTSTRSLALAISIVLPTYTITYLECTDSRDGNEEEK